MKLILFFLISLNVFSAEVSHLVNGCRIFKMDGTPVASLPGDMCLFFPDGSFVSASASALRMFDHKDSVLWEIKGNFHHQLELDQKQENILAMGNVLKNDVRFDTFVVISLAGKVLREVSADRLYSQISLKKSPTMTSEIIFTRTGARKEIGHFNSFYEIPSVQKESKHLRPGNFVVNSLSDGVFVLSPELQKVVHHFRIAQAFDHQVHDVQVTSEGQYLYFNNRVSGSGPVNRYSAIQIIDENGKLVFTYGPEPREFFYSQSCGGVQELDDDRILFSDILNATYFYSRKAKKLEKAVTGTHRNGDRPWNSPTQRVKAYDLSGFLKVRKIN